MEQNRREQLLRDPDVEEILTRLQKAEQDKKELEEQIAIVNALAWDHYTVYSLNLQTGNFRALKVGTHRPPMWEWETGEEFPYDEVIRQYLMERIPDTDREDVWKLLSSEGIEKALTTEPVHTGTYRSWNGKDMLNFQVTCKAYQVEGQEHPRVLIGFRDIDDIVRKEEQQKAALEEALNMARAASEAKTSFLSNMSHDIRTPMNAIIGCLTLMRDEIDHPEMIQEYIERIDVASRHLLSLINDVLDMDRIESGSTTLSLAEINLADVIMEINTIIHPQASAKNQTFEVFASNLNFEYLLGDEVRINQILINLLSNAVKYTPENGRIELRVEELPQVLDNYSRIRFTVSDNGLGMSEDYLKGIFDPFTREDTKATRGIQGTGLGMAITKSLVDLMGGTIKVDSKLGEGSTFVVELELRIQEKEDVSPMMGRMKEAEHHESDMVRGMHILIVDDIDVNRMILGKILGTLGAECDVACDGREAVEKFMADRYDLILMDVQMPEMDGYEAARAIRASGHPFAAAVPIIAMTANAFVDDVRDAINSGMDAHVAKPVQVDKLKATIYQVLESRAAMKNL